MKQLGLILVLVIVQLFLIAPPAVHCQTAKLDIIEYTPPAGWSKTLKDGLTLYTNSDKATGGFCLLTVYPSASSAGSPQKDFGREWADKVVKPFKAETTPKTETQTDGGWTSVSAATQIESDGVKSAVVMTVISGHGRTASVLAFFNNQQYVAQIDAFMAGIKMDKDQAVADAKPVSPTPPTPTTPVANSYNPAALVGKWGNGISGLGGATQQYYQFNADGSYSFVLSGYSGMAGRIGTYQTTTEESGVYTLNGDSMTITPKKSQTKSNGEGLKNNPLEIVTYRWTIHYFEGVREYALIMHPDHKTKRDGEFSYGYAAFPNSYGYTRKK